MKSKLDQLIEKLVANCGVHLKDIFVLCSPLNSEMTAGRTANQAKITHPCPLELRSRTRNSPNAMTRALLHRAGVWG